MEHAFVLGLGTVEPRSRFAVLTTHGGRLEQKRAKGVTVREVTRVGLGLSASFAYARPAIWGSRVPARGSPFHFL